MSDEAKPGWEVVDPDITDITERFPVAGGWLYRNRWYSSADGTTIINVMFVPMPSASPSDYAAELEKLVERLEAKFGDR